jgi:hypothetical protein
MTTALRQVDFHFESGGKAMQAAAIVTLEPATSVLTGRGSSLSG